MSSWLFIRIRTYPASSPRPTHTKRPSGNFSCIGSNCIPSTHPLPRSAARFQSIRPFSYCTVVRSAWLNIHNSHRRRPYPVLSFELLSPKYETECWRLHRDIWRRHIKRANYFFHITDTLHILTVTTSINECINKPQVLSIIKTFTVSTLGCHPQKIMNKVIIERDKRLRRLVIGLTPCRPWLNPRPVYVGLMVEKRQCERFFSKHRCSMGLMVEKYSVKDFSPSTDAP